MRQSKDSSLTVPYEKTYNYEVYCMKANLKPDRKYNACLCGWPQNLLFPRGTGSGLKFDLFAMITNFHEDKVIETILFTNVLSNLLTLYSD